LALDIRAIKRLYINQAPIWGYYLKEEFHNMKSLNRTLSLVLVLVMVLGMFGIAGAAFTDAKDVKYNEAVDVMSAIGVIDGMNGAFNPKGNLTREQAAKILCYLTMGKAAADNLKTSVAPFKDVNADRWSAGSIAYCVQQNIISGRGDGTFDPAANVTGYEFAKMLLVALGYDPAIEGFTGSAWTVNVAKRAHASTNKLFAGNDAFNGNLPATREEAALYSLNLIQAGLVTYATKGGDIKLPDGTVIHQPASAPDQSNNATFMATYYPKLKLDKNAVDDSGRAVRKWTNGATVIGTYSASNAVASWTADHTGDDNTVDRALAGYTYVKGSVYTNGVPADKDPIALSDIKNATGNGNLVEVFANEKNEIYRVAVTTTKLATIVNKDTVNKTVTVNTGTAQATLTAKSDIADFGNAYTALYNKNVGDKVLLVNKEGTGKITAIYSYADPTVVSGQFTGISKDGFTIGGKAYEISAGDSGEVATALVAANLGKAYSLFLDAYGYIIGVNSSATTTTYAYMIQGSRDGSAMAGYAYNAQLLFADGTVKWVPIAAYDGKTEESARFDASELKNEFVAYTALTDGSYTLTKTGVTQDTVAGPKKIEKDSSAFNSKLVSNSTVFLIYNNTTKTYDSYMGIKNVPTTVIPDGSTAYALESGDTYKMVVVKNSATTSADVVYIYDATSIGASLVNGTAVKSYKAIVNGVIGTVQVIATETPSVGLYAGNTYTGSIITKLGSSSVTEIATDTAATFSKTYAATKPIAKTVALTDNNAFLTDGVLSVTNGSEKITGIVGTSFVCYDTKTTAGTATVKSLGAESKVTGTLYFVLDSNGYVAFAIIA